MAENLEFTDATEREVLEVMARLIGDQDWEEEDKERLHREYMTEFGVVLREMMPQMIELFHDRKPTVAESTNDDGEALEKAKVRHEATLIAVTKRRKEYPHYLSKLLGKTLRLKKNTAAAMKVDTPPAEPMEAAATGDLDDSYLDVLKEQVNGNLLESTHNILSDMDRLSGLMDFARFSKQMDPLPSIFGECCKTKP
ncbi:hypothetical protein GWK47_013754 [Chionoecetes opilio]|uniref:Uncharacterized protein n=1 Tax=Chionoecetes opilio TaxID=41210 RepID=A0A8J4XVX3_CHIOP|nr:hypothetical protein GWK47_013754 [Chionoecetes opilio]